MLRLGLCCLFREAPIKFKRTTARYLATQSRRRQLTYLSAICLHNANALMRALQFCEQKGIGGFRVNSQILPLKTHPTQHYDIEDLPDNQAILKQFRKCGAFGRKHNLRISFHPDQFILLSSPDSGVTRRSVADLTYQAEVASWIRADVLNIHAGGAYGDKRRALSRLARRIEKLPERVRTRLTLENDDRIFTPADLLPFCKNTGVPFVYDVHHHRCQPDGMRVEDTTAKALDTWNREPLFHISSPLDGWKTKNARRHHDYINIKDFPKLWLDLNITVEVEAKAKELAVMKLRKDIESQHRRKRAQK
ncbi:MAG: UV DNA damage repair endonuclease UvsE [Deltaproteobacteria bacterium]|jgi:UV DNA damage endonuclease|nr:UV DNA damage repair endonuclease UvsE [Deltaproteobacteria bacterium]